MKGKRKWYIAVAAAAAAGALSAAPLPGEYRPLGDLLAAVLSQLSDS